jgi:hypothetical protein
VPDLDYLMANTRQCLLNQLADLSVCANQNNFVIIQPGIGEGALPANA